MFKKFFYSLNLLCLSFFALPVKAAPSLLKGVANQAFGASTNDTGGKAQELILYEQIGLYIQIVMRFVGVLLLVVILYAGFLWLTAGGNDTKVEEAKKWIRNGVIGLVLVSLTHVIVGFVVATLLG